MHGQLRFLAFIPIAALCAMGEAQAECPAAGARAIVLKSVVDGDTFLAADGSEIDLAGVLAPGSGGERLARTQMKESQAALSQELSRGALTLAFTGAEKDRYGRLPAQVFAGTEWVQGALLLAGRARANPDMATACASELLAAEVEARDAKRGRWGDGSFVVYGVDGLAHKEGTFQIVEGTVQAVAAQKGRAYLDFGPDWHSDFTVMIAPDEMKQFRHEKVNVKALSGKRVRVRGWIESYYGPEIELASPGALEILDKTEKPGR